MAATKNPPASEQKSSQPRVSALRQLPLPPGDDVGAAEMGRRVAVSVREKRKTRGMSLDQLASASGVSRAALSQIETQKSNPTLGVLWKIAVGLGVPFSELLGGGSKNAAILRRGDSQVLRSADGRMESRPLTPAGACPWVEAYELRFSARATHTSDPHAAGTREVVIALNGSLRIRVAEEVHELAAGDSIAFLADVPHVYENPGSSEVRCHDIIIYAR
jgi:XRE family transcriptional regulator, regulator of sulfur utilization